MLEISVLNITGSDFMGIDRPYEYNQVYLRGQVAVVWPVSLVWPMVLCRVDLGCVTYDKSQHSILSVDASNLSLESEAHMACTGASK